VDREMPGNASPEPPVLYAAKTPDQKRSPVRSDFPQVAEERRVESE